MGFPNIQFKATNTEVDEELQILLEQKLSSLEKYLNTETDLVCEVEFEKVSHHQSGNVHRVEVNFFKNGELFRAEAIEDSYEKAIDEVRDELDKELRRNRNKKETMFRKGARRLKEMMRRH
mgnify:CR=1 FL=1